MSTTAVEITAVETPTTVFVRAVCPKCKQGGIIMLAIESELRVSDADSTLHLRTRSKPLAHLCDQLALELDEGAAK